jgi:hypothetical protein
VVLARRQRVVIAASEQRPVTGAGLDDGDPRNLDARGLDGHARVDGEVVGRLGGRDRFDRSVGVHLELRVLDTVPNGESGGVGKRIDVDAHGERPRPAGTALDRRVTRP